MASTLTLKHAMAQLRQSQGAHGAAVIAQSKEALVQATSWQKVNGRLRKPIISPMALAKLRKEAVLMDVEFPLPAPEPKVYKPRAPKGHAFERAKIERMKKIEENMKKMPKMVAEHREKQRKERQQKKLDKKSFMKTQSLF